MPADLSAKDRARRPWSPDVLKQELAVACADLETAQKNLARAKTDEQFTAISKEFDERSQRKANLEDPLAETTVCAAATIDPDREVEAALTVLRHLEKLVDGEHAGQESPGPAQHQVVPVVPANAGEEQDSEPAPDGGRDNG